MIGNHSVDRGSKLSPDSSIYPLSVSQNKMSAHNSKASVNYRKGNDVPRKVYQNRYNRLGY